MQGWLVAGGHMTEAPAIIVYVSVMCIETIRIAIMITALNNIEGKLDDILNVYVQTPVAEKVLTILGP